MWRSNRAANQALWGSDSWWSDFLFVCVYLYVCVYANFRSPDNKMLLCFHPACGCCCLWNCGLSVSMLIWQWGCYIQDVLESFFFFLARNYLFWSAAIHGQLAICGQRLLVFISDANDVWTEPSRRHWLINTSRALDLYQNCSGHHLLKTQRKDALSSHLHLLLEVRSPSCTVAFLTCSLWCSSVIMPASWSVCICFVTERWHVGNPCSPTPCTHPLLSRQCCTINNHYVISWVLTYSTVWVDICALRTTLTTTNPWYSNHMRLICFRTTWTKHQDQVPVLV